MMTSSETRAPVLGGGVGGGGVANVSPSPPPSSSPPPPVGVVSGCAMAGGAVVVASWVACLVLSTDFNLGLQSSTDVLPGNDKLLLFQF